MQPIRSANDTTEFRRNYDSAECVNGLYALDAGWTGKGVTVGVIDDGVNASLSEFAGRISPLSRSFGTVTRNGVTTARPRGDLGDAASSTHGTPVAAIIGANRDGSGPMGYAPEVSLAILNDSDYNYDTGVSTISGYATIDYAIANNIRVINRSISQSGGSPQWQAMMDRYAAAKGLLIEGAGNSSGPNPNQAADVTATNVNSWLFVVALNTRLALPYAIESYSNRAGTMMNRTVTAPGDNVTIGSTGATRVFSGTSSATPVVTALAATILQKWPQLTGQDAGNIILNTARDIGDPGPDPVFGRGLVDFKAALSPVNPTLSNGMQTVSINKSAMAVAPALGAAGLRASLTSVTVLDAYGRDFTGSVAGLVVKPETSSSSWLRRRLLQMQSGGGVGAAIGNFTTTLGFASTRFGTGRTDVRSSVTTGRIGYRDGAIGVTIGFNAQDDLQSDALGLAPFADGTLAYAPQAGNSLTLDRPIGIGRISFSLGHGRQGPARATTATASLTMMRTTLRASLIDEDGAVFGLAGTGALTLGRGSTTAMVEAKQAVGLINGWRLEGYGSVGITSLKIDPTSVVTGATPLIGTRLGLQASGPAMGGTLSFGIAQPLTIESGQALLTLGRGYDLDSRSLTFSHSTASLASDVRRIDITAGFVRAWRYGLLRLGTSRDVATGDTKALLSFSTAR